MKSVAAAAATAAAIFAGVAVEASPRVDLTNVLGAATTLPAFERITCQPVFQVTTPWGSPYMLFEKYKDEEKAYVEGTDTDVDDAEKFSRQQKKDDMQDTRPVSLYFCDEHDARALADEMKQMKHMKGSDLRVTCTTLAKAVRHSSNIGKGLPTGQPVDDKTGKMLTMEDGGSLRHKIVPSKRDLFYATRCRGRERVGFFGNSADEDAELMLQPDDIIEANKMGERKKTSKSGARRLQQAREAESEGVEESEENLLRRQYAHMEGQVGMPVFHCPGLTKSPPMLSRILRGAEKAWASSSLTPLYFSYEDLLRDWNAMREKNANMPASPDVEVFNMFDIVTSIDRDQWKGQRREELRRARMGVMGHIPVLRQFLSKGKAVASTGLEKVVFVPTSLGAQAKVRISGGGNGKARLARMRAWGK